MNRTVMTLVAALNLVSGVALAQAPAVLPVQGVLTDTAGNRLSDGNQMVTFRLYAQPTGGTAIFSETLNVSLVNGLFTEFLGAQSGQPLDLTLLPANGMFLGIQVGADPEMTPRVRIASVPYAAYSEFAGDAVTLNSRPDTDFASNTHDHPFSELTGVPSGLADGDDDTTYSPGNGVNISGSNQVSVDPNYVQRRVGSCPAGQTINGIMGDGTPICLADQNTTYTPGPGLQISSANEIAVDATYRQRLAAGCPAGQSIRTIAESGTVQCEVDNDTRLTPGTGISLSGTTLSVTNYNNLAVTNPTTFQRFDNGTFTIDPTQNFVGVRDTTPDFPLDVLGDSYVSGSRRMPARSFYEMYDASDFRTPSSNVGQSIDYYFPNDTLTKVFYANPRLPEGATIREVRCYFADRSTGDIENMDMFLYRRTLSSQAYTTLLSAPYNPPNFQSTTTVYSNTRSVTANNVVNNSLYNYVLQVNFDMFGTLFGSSYRFYGCRIRYTMEFADRY